MASPYLQALFIGAAAGLRAMTAPAATLRSGNSGFSGASTVLAAGEFLADKLPFIPARTSPPAYAVRLLSGGWSGGEVAQRNEGSRAVGIALGALAAGATTWVFYSLRRELTTRRGWPDFPVALVEDALAIWLARAATAGSPR